MVGQIRVLSETDIKCLLTQGGTKLALEIIDLMAKTFSKYSGHSTDIQSPQRISVSTDLHKVLFMPSRLETTTSIKIVSVPSDDRSSGLPATILVLDESSGSVEAIMNAVALTAIRTAAGSGVATNYYANPDSRNLVVFGAGAQGRSHVDMMIAIRPTIQQVAIWNRRQARRDRLIEELKRDYPDRLFVSANEALESYVREADIICTCTNATEPVLFGKWLKPGVHLNCVGSYQLHMHEVDAETIQRAELIVVDSTSACAHEAGELVLSSQPEAWVELGQVVLDQKDRQKITLFKSVGISVQDSAIAGLILQQAKNRGLGLEAPF
ncbi:hypothetical protein EDC96DRAFT_517991 [Choanephora cucurbitarum]|nr:hypothetical protein EDC96DRAFT_517991 [Choanephora cucurbitarum]